MLFELDPAISSSIDLRSSQAWPPSVFGRQLAALISKLTLAKKTVVDIGCGSGIQAIAAAKCGATVSASDISPEAVEATRLNAHASGVSIEVKVGPGIDPWVGRSFDVVICNGPTYETPNDDSVQFAAAQRLRPIPLIVLEIMKRHHEFLTPGGRFVGLVCGPFSSAVVRAAAAHHGLYVELIFSLDYFGSLEDFGGCFDSAVAIRSGFAEPIDSNFLIKGAAFVMRRRADISQRTRTTALL